MFEVDDEVRVVMDMGAYDTVGCIGIIINHNEYRKYPFTVRFHETNEFGHLTREYCEEELELYSTKKYTIKDMM